MKCKIYYSNSHDPYLNLAIEEYLLDNIELSEVIFFVWQNQHTLVIGKHQNPWKECNIEQMEKDGVKLARRITGGGAVFHDLGNINYSFIAGKDYYDTKSQFEVILHMAKSLGIDAEFSGRNDILAAGRKFSGNAFCMRSNGGLHHGTILVNADMEKLTNYLRVSLDKIQSKGIDSIRSRVVNLAELNEEITMTKVTSALVASFKHLYDYTVEESFFELHENADQIQALYDRNASWDWCFGNSPKFDVSLSTRFTWGGIDLGLYVKDGIVQEAKVYSDALDSDFISGLSPLLADIHFRKDAIIGKLDSIDVLANQREYISDIKEWIGSLNLGNQH